MASGFIDTSSLSKLFSPTSQAAPTSAAIQEAVPYRKEVYDNIVAKQTLFNTDLPAIQDAGVTNTSTNPLKLFLDTEVSWWNANVLLALPQINDRNNLFNKKLDTLTQALEGDIIKVLKTLDKATLTTKLTTLAPVKIVSMDNIKAIVVDGADPQQQKLNDIYNNPTPDPLGMASIAYTNFVNNYLMTTIVVIVALIIASFVANDYLYKHPSYRILAFFMVLAVSIYTSYSFIAVLAVYYIYRYISFLFFDNTENMVVRLTLLPIAELSPQDYANANWFLKYIYTYTLGEEGGTVQRHVSTMKLKESADRLLRVENTKNIQEQILTLRKESSF